jgi:hypothetical protein
VEVEGDSDALDVWSEVGEVFERDTKFEAIWFRPSRRGPCEWPRCGPGNGDVIGPGVFYSV